MPLLRDLRMRLFDNYVGHNLTSIVRNDFQSQFDLSEYSGSYPATGVQVAVPNAYVFQLEDADCIVGLAKSSPGNTLATKTGHIHDFSTFQDTSCVLFDAPRGYSGHLYDEDNDSLLVPGEVGAFTISLWVNPYSAPSGTYDIIGKKIASASANRFLLRCDTTGDDPVIRFSAASEDGASEASVEAKIVLSRWSLVVARCFNKRLSLCVYGADGIIEAKKKTHTSRLGCSLVGESLYCGIGVDGSSNPLHSGSFYLQQVCFWKKEITDNEITELFNLGRGKTRFSDTAVPETFTGTGKYGSIETLDAATFSVDLDSDGLVTKVYPHSELSPYLPCKTCDSEPCCYPNAMMDPSPDSIDLSVSWSASPGGCIPSETSFTMTRLPRQIIQGFIFGRTFESEKITLPCGGYVKFFLESTPYHWSKYRYRQYLGVETNYGGSKRYAKFNVTMGSALVRNNVTGGSNKFTSPSPAGVNFDFPYSDSFSDYASDIVSSGWTGSATVVLEEAFSTDNCGTNSADAACIVADGYRFAIGVDYPESRGGDCGWQMGVSEFASGSTVLSTQDSRYNYKITCGSPGVSNNSRVTPSDSLFHRPFSAIARGLICAHNSDGEIVDANLPFSGFSAVLTPSEFVRPEPFTQIVPNTLRQQGPGGCIDCEVSATFTSDDETPGAGITSSTRKITQKNCPQKTLSGAVSPVLAGAQGGNGEPGTALLRMLGSPAIRPNDTISTAATFADPQENSNWLTHLGGTLRANGRIQFTSQIDNYNQGNSREPFLHLNIKDNRSIDPNNEDSSTPLISRGTSVDPYKTYTTPIPSGEEDNDGFPVSVRYVKKTNPDKGTISSYDDIELRPATDSQVMLSSDCVFCNKADFCSSGFTGSLSGIVYEYPAQTSGTHPSQCTCDFVTTPNVTNPVIRAAADPIVGCSGVVGFGSGNFSTATIINIEMNKGAWSVVDFESCPSGSVISGSATKNNSPTPFAIVDSGVFPPSSVSQLLTRPLVYHYPDSSDCETNPVFQFFTATTTTSTPICNDLQKSVSGSFGGITFSRDSSTGILSAAVRYTVAYHEWFRSTHTGDYYESYEYDATENSILGGIITHHVDYPQRHLQQWTVYSNALVAVTETREAIFSATAPACVHAEGEDIVLSFQSESVITRTSVTIPYTVPDGVEGPTGTYTYQEDTAEPSCSMLDPSESIPSPYDQPEFSNHVQVHPEAIWLTNGDGSPGGHVTSGFTVHATTVTTVSPHPSSLPEPDTLIIPQFIDLSGAIITLSGYDPTGGLSRPIGYLSSYFIGDDEYSVNVHPSWIFSDEDFVKAIFPSACLYEVYEKDDTGHATRVVARYRVSGFPYSRWNRDRDNQMQLVSADWSVMDWPIYLTVSSA